jgi:hypothetical protein
MSRMRKFNTVLMFLSVIASVPASAESFTGYVVESLNGANGTNPVYDASLIGLSTSSTGPVTLYRFTTDRTYAEMLTIARIHRQPLSISYSGSTITGVYIR